jgi:hypothetical protein
MRLLHGVHGSTSLCQEVSRMREKVVFIGHPHEATGAPRGSRYWYLLTRVSVDIWCWALHQRSFATKAHVYRQSRMRKPRSAFLNKSLPGWFSHIILRKTTLSDRKPQYSSDTGPIGVYGVTSRRECHPINAYSLLRRNIFSDLAFT